MEPRRPNIAVRLGLELLEDRMVPGTLIITPPAAAVSSSDQYIVACPDDNTRGILTAQAHTGGVVQLRGR